MNWRQSSVRRLLVLCAALLGVAPLGASAQADRPFVIVVEQEAPTLDPAYSLTSSSTEPLMANVMDPLIGVNVAGNPVPTVATWTVIDGGKIVDFHVKPGIKFQSGDPLTAEDIVFSFERSLANSPTVKSKFGRSIEKIEALNPTTARFTFKSPTIAIVNDRNVYVGSKAYHDRVGEQSYFEHPNGTGPYKLVEYKRGQYADLEAFPGYRGGLPQIRKARIYFIKDDATRVAKLQSGEADLIESAPWNSIETLKKAGFHIATAPSFPFMSIHFQTYDPNTPWAKLKVRQAIAHAIDGDAIAKGLLDGIPTREPMLSKGEIGYDPKMKPYSFDPALAKKLLVEAGYPNGFTMPFFYPQTYYGMRETAEAVALYLKNVGITTTVTQLDALQNQQMLAKQSKDPTFQYVQLRAMPFSNADDTATQLDFTMSQNSATSIYKAPDDRFEKLTEQSLTIFDPAKRGDVVRQATDLLYNNVAFIGLWHAVTQYAMKSNVTYTPVPRTHPLVHIWEIKLK